MHEHGGNLPGKAVSTIARYGMLKGGEKVVISVSGGPDSIALLYFMADIAGGMDLELSVFHLDHMIRGEDSAEDAQFVSKVATKLALPVRSDRVDVKKEMKAGSRSPQDAARAIRLDRLLHYADEIGADRIATGHTADDQVETFLMRAVQGAGLTGLAGIPPVSGDVIRPLIEVWRFEVESFLTERDLSARLDRSNLELTYLRNRVRLRLLPSFVAEFGEVVKEVILRDVASLAEDREFFQRLAREALQENGVAEEGEVRLDRGALLEMPPSLLRGVIREAWARVAPGEPMLGWQHVLDIVENVVNGASGSRIDLPRDIVAEREYEQVLVRESEPQSQDFGPVDLDVPGSVRLPWGEVISSQYVEVKPEMFVNDPDIEFARPDTGVPLTVRTPRPGDRFRPLGSAYQRKLKDFFIDKKVPRRVRRRVPLVLEGDHIVWVAGQRLDDRYKLRINDTRAIRLSLRKERPAGEQR